MAAQSSVIDLANYRRARNERVADASIVNMAPTGFALVWVPVWFSAIAMPHVAQPHLAPRVGDDRPAG